MNDGANGGEDELIQIIMGVIEKIEPLLHGHEPIVQGAVLADLTTTFLRGHHPIEWRRAVFNTHFEQIRQQIENDDDGETLNE